MTNTLTISRDLAERLDSPHSSVRNAALESLRRIIAAPVVERQPIAHRIEFTDGHKSKWIDGAPASIDIDDAREGVIAGVELAFASPPAPVAVDDQQALQDRHEAWMAGVEQGKAESLVLPVALNTRMAAILQSLCTNANPALFAPGQLAEVDACLDKVKEMNR